MKVILTIVKIDNKFEKDTAHISASLNDGFLSKTTWLYADVVAGVKVGSSKEYTVEEFNTLNISKKESKSTPGRFYNVLTL